MRAAPGRAWSAPGAIARVSRRIDISALGIAFPAWPGMVNRVLLLGTARRGFLAESRVLTQGANMSGRVTFLAAAILLAGGEIAAAQGCATAITDFRFVINTETSMGHVKQAAQANAMAELARIDQTCRAGRNAEAMTALQALQRRMGFR